MPSLQLAKRYHWYTATRFWAVLAFFAILLGIGSSLVYRQQIKNLRAFSIPVVTLSDLVEGEEYRLESFVTVNLLKNKYANAAYIVMISSDNLSSYCGKAMLVVAKQLVEIYPADSTRPATATVTTVVSEGSRTRVLQLRPQHLRPDPEPRDLLATLPAGDK
ncbi:MAG: hypothetical protein WC693_01295 [Patescibacteria group bacterium]|jgi:hypothetical protein